PPFFIGLRASSFSFLTDSAQRYRVPRFASPRRRPEFRPSTSAVERAVEPAVGQFGMGSALATETPFATLFN
ncbi:MAG: hypothetical protein O7D96_10915, partial [SAR324 cluster bacterium]|nr:hypothetical protein [SAR324 cluster bacterium]